MSDKWDLRSALLLTAVLTVFYIGYGLAHPTRIKGRVQRVSGVNIVRSVSIDSRLLDTTPVPPSMLPNKGR
jgi:hypothetical protein